MSSLRFMRRALLVAAAVVALPLTAGATETIKLTAWTAIRRRRCGPRS